MKWTISFCVNYLVLIVLINKFSVSSQQISINKNNLNEKVATAAHNLDISDGSINQYNSRFLIKRSASTTSSSPSTNEALPDQPIRTAESNIKKCCPNGQTFINNKPICVDKPKTVEFQPTVIEAKFFENCIEDLETNITLDVTIRGTCFNGAIFSSFIDDIYIIQNGSLLIVDPLSEYYDIYFDYCIETTENGTIAIVCDIQESTIISLTEIQTYITAACMLISVPCLLITAFFHLKIKQLRNLHGETLGCHSICLAIGFGLMAIVQLTHVSTTFIGYLIQYFILACFLWLSVMCIDICLHVWYYLPKKIDIEEKQQMRFIIYFIISMTIPLMIVIATHIEGLSGMPSYYLKGVTEATQLSQRYFIPPICVLLCLNIILFITIYVGMKRVTAENAKDYLSNKKNHLLNGTSCEKNDAMEEVKRTTKTTAWLFVIMTVNWIFEILSFYIHGIDSLLIIFDICNALQGVFIFILFVCLKHYNKIIRRWWVDRGRLDTNDRELQQFSLTTTQQQQE